MVSLSTAWHDVRAAWTYCRSSPLHTRERQHFRRRWWLPAALAATILVIAVAVLIEFLLDRPGMSARGPLGGHVYSRVLEGAVLLQFIGLPGLQLVLGSGLAVQAALDVRRAESNGEFDLLRLTSLYGHQLARLFLVRNILNITAWCIALPSLSLHFFIYAVLFSGAGWWIPLILPLGGVQAGHAMLQLAACVAIGLRAGQSSATPEGAIGRAVSRVVVVEGIVPIVLFALVGGVCGYCDLVFWMNSPDSRPGDGYEILMAISVLLVVAVYWYVLCRYQLFVFSDQRRTFAAQSADAAEG